jgi:Cu2+-containing amine oxidase
MAQATTGSPRTSVRHPLAPLTPDEAGLASRLALDAAGPGARLVYCALAEPAKKAVMEWDGRPLRREARCVLYERPAG